MINLLDRIRSVIVAVVCVLFVPQCCAWHEPHISMTRAALFSLPAAMRQQLGGEGEHLIEVYCMYADRYDNASALEKAAMRVFNERPDGHKIHNVTWSFRSIHETAAHARLEDLASLEYLLQGLISNLQLKNTTSAAQYAGTLAHFLEDSVSPAHAMDLALIQDLLPPPPGVNDLHAAIEIDAPKFDLTGRSPRDLGRSIPAVAEEILDRCYPTVKDNRAHLLEMTKAVYEKDKPTIDRLRLRAARAGAELLADAYYTAFLLADSSSSETEPSGVHKPALYAQWPGIDLEIETDAPLQHSAIQRQAAANLVFGLREALRVLHIDARVQRTRFGAVRVVLSSIDEAAGEHDVRPHVEMMGSWPPYTGSQVLHFYFNEQGLLAGGRITIRGIPRLGSERISENQSIRTVDHRGDPLYHVLILGSSALTVTNHNNEQCSLRAANGTFADGVLVFAGETEPLLVQTSEDRDHQTIRVNIKGRLPEVVSSRSK